MFSNINFSPQIYAIFRNIQSGPRKFFAVGKPFWHIFRKLRNRIPPQRHFRRFFRHSGEAISGMFLRFTYAISKILLSLNGPMSINTTETMLSEQIKRFLLPHTFNAAVRAGAAVMRIYEHRDDYDLSKYDGNFRSITAADRAAHEAIKRTLGQTTRSAATGNSSGWSIRWTARANSSPATTSSRSTSP